MKKPIVKKRIIKVTDPSFGGGVELDGYSVVNFTAEEVAGDDPEQNKLNAIVGLFNDQQGPIEMWNGTWEKYCGYES